MTATDARRGAAAALAAYLLWGVFGLFFKMLASVPAFEVLCHRIVWSAVLNVALVLALGKGDLLLAVFADRKRLAGLAASAVFITVNWGFYIWAVGHGHALDASLGYFVYPLASVAFGAILLHERLNRRQAAAIGLVCIGVGVLAAGLGRMPWLVLVFPLSFGPYGLLRKVVPVDALVGLTVETLILAPFALAFLLSQPHGGAIMTQGWGTALLLLASGPVTALPLVLFAYGARRLTMATLGLMQYVNPTIQMAVAVMAFGEAMTTTHQVTFAFIWAGLLLYSLPLSRAARADGSADAQRAQAE